MGISILVSIASLLASGLAWGMPQVGTTLVFLRYVLTQRTTPNWSSEAVSSLVDEMEVEAEDTWIRVRAWFDANKILDRQIVRIPEPAAERCSFDLEFLEN